jgi:hypothetical protein
MSVNVFSKRFFQYYLCVEELDLEDESEEITVQLMLTPQHGFQLEIALDVASVDLSLIHPLFDEPKPLGWSDMAHWQSHVFRVEEVDKLIPVIEIQPAVTNPRAVARVLLSLFTLPDQTNAPHHQTAMHEVLRSIGFSNSEIEDVEHDVFHPHVFRALTDAEWLNEGDRWFVVGEGSYSLRNPGNPDFPHDELADVLSLNPG